METIQTEIIALVIAVLTACVGWVTQKVTSFLNQKGLIEKMNNHKAMVKIVVNAVEQMYQEADGNKKFELAKLELLNLLNEKKIRMTEAELDLLIESVVKEMNDSVKEGLGK